jgi:hypothetical protein
LLVLQIKGRMSQLWTGNHANQRPSTAYMQNLQRGHEQNQHHARPTSSLGVSEDDDAEGRRWYALKI